MRFAPARDRLRPRRVEASCVTFIHLGEVGPDAIEIDGLGLRRSRGFDRGLLDKRERMTLEHGVALGDGDLPHESVDVCADDVLHLHRFHHE